MKAIDLRKKPETELISLLREALIEKEELALGLHQKKLKNVKALKTATKNIARIRTILRESRL
ncbi:MAG: 50S ribosomal protein L29 [Candidatus Sungbacteria bacterium]|uniref:Large ribosomal subunit protein uL29 n=1 Tax=Candidatus Sungiibacteriota bacterium TaxID=2750080 RepID=A0A932YWC1_9BACT|nr:50S ribosomal protein L29 [Candidatus Sungbacteria bacterium]